MELGFVEKPDVEEENEASGTLFASKVGGKPVWPDSRELPAGLNCEKCNKPLTFLLQFHAPISHFDEDSEDPRTLFVFMCKDPECHSPGDARCFVVLRYEGANNTDVMVVSPCEGQSSGGQSNAHASGLSQDLAQLSCDTDLTSNDLAVNSHDLKHSTESNRKPDSIPSLCIVCGGCGLKQCGGCRKVNYCSRAHQIHDWKLGHKTMCPQLSRSQSPSPPLSYDPSVGVLLPEWDLVTEPEPETCWKGTEERSEEARMADYERYVKEKGVAQEKAGLSGEALERAASEMKKEGSKDKVFKTFMKRIAAEHQQVLRYERGGKELFISKERIPKSSDIAKCKCGVARTFELQVMPQLLYYLKLDHTSLAGPSPSGQDIDWGTLLVYTCGASSCQLGRGYHRELLWKQEIS